MAAVSVEQDSAKMSQASQTCFVCLEAGASETCSVCLNAVTDWGEAVASETCSVCLNAVTDSGDRSITKLKCGHDFHLDCIGSAFNAKGEMQCPNCRHVENSQWLTRSRPTGEFMNEIFPEEYRDLALNNNRAITLSNIELPENTILWARVRL